MLPSSQRCCRTAFSRPIGLQVPWERRQFSCLAAIIPVPQASRSQASSLFHNSRPRYFTISHARHAESFNTPSPGGRPAVTTSSSAATHIHPDVSQPHSTGRPKLWRRRGFYYATGFMFVGMVAGTIFSTIAVPPAVPSPGSDLELYLKSKIQAQGNALPIVQQLSADPAWTSWDAYADISTTPSPANPLGISVVQSRIISGPMSGSVGLAFQRIFHNASTGEIVTVVYFGPALSGWPGVVHGGALATVLDETLGRCAILQFPSRTGVTANLELQYRRPTRTHNFYVVKARPVVDEAGGKNGTGRKLWVQGQVETVDGKVTVEAKALFVVPKSFELRPLVEGF